MHDSEEPIRMLTWLLLNTLGITVFVFGLLLWGYSVTIQLTHPEWLADTLTHHAFYPPLNMRVDDAGTTGFAIAPFGFFTTRSRLPSSRREKPRLLPRNAPLHAIGRTNPTQVTSLETTANVEPMISKARRLPRTNRRSQIEHD